MTKYFKISVISIIVFAANVNAQQDPLYAQYQFNGLVINPAYAGTHEVLSATLLYRNQWVNMPGAPKTFTFSADAPFRKNKVGLGMTVIADKIGITKRNALNGIYSYKIPMKKATLALGVQMGLSFFSSNYTDVNYDNRNRSTDNAFSQNTSNTYPNIGFGAYYFTDKYYIGASMPSFINSSLLEKYFSKPDAYNFSQSNHMFITGGYVFDINSDLKIKPSALMVYVYGANPQVDINTTAWLFETLGLGVSYKSFDAVNAFTEIKVLPQLYFGYAFEYSLTNLRNYNSGTHEIMLRYDFDFAHPRVITPRYF
ncbi:MAG TPA: type IX secretion system membrane protein PorP/SprF [Bacteroidales bacterium]|nr:type IX secretion system membrane protein PorP/SprF [Bacteroidales bacterium]